MTLPYITASVDVENGARDIVCSVDCAEQSCVCIVAPVTIEDIEATVIGTCAGCGRVLIEDGILVAH